MAINFRRVLCSFAHFLRSQQSAQTGSPQIDVAWLVRPAQSLASMSSRWRILGASARLPDAGAARDRGLQGQAANKCPKILGSHAAGGKSIAEKFRRYAVIRTLASLVTGLMVAVLCWAPGVELASAWGVLAFVLNFIPFIDRSWRPYCRRCSPSCSSSPGRRRP